MAVLINFKICDNDKACSGMRICPQGVFSWNEDKHTLEIDNSKCINCGLCEQACMVNAIKVARTEEEYVKIQKALDSDPRNINDLLVERYGATPIDPAMIGKSAEIIEKISGATRPLIIELYQEDTIECLLKSIPIKKIADAFDKDTRFRKIEVLSENIINQYDIKELPALLFFKNGNLLGRFEGYITEDDEQELFNKINDILNKRIML